MKRTWFATVLSVIVISVMAGGLFWVFVQPQDTDPAGVIKVTKSQQVDSSDWQSLWQSAGFKGDRAIRPNGPKQALEKLARDLASPAALKKRLSTWLGDKSLRLVDPQVSVHRRVQSAGDLAAVLARGAAPALYPVELVWLLVGLCDQGANEHRVWLSAAPDPLVLSKLNLSVQCGDELLTPMGAKAPDAVQVSDSTLAGWWTLTRAQLARTRQEFTVAHRDIALADKLMGSSAAPQFARGVLQIAQSMVDRGVETCESALAKRDDPWARLFLADVLAAMSKPFKAFRHARAVIDRHPQLAEGHVSLALLNAGRAQSVPEAGRAKLIDEAKAGFERAIKIRPAVPGARAGLAQLALLQGDHEMAEKILRVAVTKHHDIQAALVLSELLQMSQRAEQAVEVLKTLGHDEDERVVAALIKSMVLAGDSEAAARQAKLGVQRLPHSAEIALLYADILRQLGKASEAVAVLSPHNKGQLAEQISGLQIQILLQAGKQQKALKLLGPLLSKDKISRELGMLGLIAYALTDKSDEQHQLALRLTQKGVMTWSEVVGTLVEAGDPDGAESALNHALSTLAKGQKQWLEMASTLAMIYTASGRKGEALALADKLAGDLTDPEQTKTLRKAIDEAIAGAEAELAKMKQEQGATELGAPQSP
ncbi:MAG TPA: hypothetical protein DCQ06_08625 [Myxococcales bacterium]|nr:hypothetical protein [Myxococcales bacterium]HAN31645.1 hypothetical protein [Myxococcales bacterium]